MNIHRSYYYASVIPSVQSTGLPQLAIAMLCDLGLNRPFRETDNPAEVMTDLPNGIPDRKKESGRSTDERRAFVSCFILSSV
jgi:hypothetical protein